MKYTRLFYLVLIITISCTEPSEQPYDQSDKDDHPLIGDWEGFVNFHAGGDYFEMMYLLRDFRITKDSIYEMKYPTSFTSKYAFNLNNDSILLIEDDKTINYQWFIKDSILTLITSNSEVHPQRDTTTYFRSKFQESYFKKIINLKINTEVLERFSWNFDYEGTLHTGWKNMDTMIYNPPKVMNFSENNYKLNQDSEIICELDTFTIIRFHKWFFMSDIDTYFLQLEKIIEKDTVILTYRTP